MFKSFEALRNIFRDSTSPESTLPQESMEPAFQPIKETREEILKRHAEQLREVEKRNQEYFQRLNPLWEKNNEIARRIKDLNREERSDQGRAFREVVGERGAHWEELRQVRREINQILDLIEEDDALILRLQREREDMLI